MGELSRPSHGKSAFLPCNLSPMTLKATPPGWIQTQPCSIRLQLAHGGPAVNPWRDFASTIYPPMTSGPGPRAGMDVKGTAKAIVVRSSWRCQHLRHARRPLVIHGICTSHGYSSPAARSCPILGYVCLSLHPLVARPRIASSVVVQPLASSVQGDDDDWQLVDQKHYNGSRYWPSRHWHHRSRAISSASAQTAAFL